VLVALSEQETVGIDIVTDGEQSRQHFVHGFLQRIHGIDFSRRVSMGIRANRYMAEVPVVTGELRRESAIHRDEVRWARAHTRRTLKFTIPGPMTIVDTVADEHYGDRAGLAHAFARIINDEARELVAEGLDVLQLDEPAFNVYLQEVGDWGMACLEDAIAGLDCKTAVHICYGYGIPANIAWKHTLGEEWRHYEAVFPLLASSSVDQVSLECAGSRVPLPVLNLLEGKDVLLGCIDVATDRIETANEVAALIEAARRYVPLERLYPCTNCGMAPMTREVARQKLAALSAGAHLARTRLG
jgi:5-methyltetrahydropteroyltriglutamate--homocysteine methyltransferase